MPVAACVCSCGRSRRVSALSWIALLFMLVGPTAAARAQGGAPRALENPRGRITLRDALRLALLKSPELAGLAWEVRAREARVLQAGRPPNPWIETLVEDLGGGRVVDGGRIGEPQTTIQLSQLIELGGKRAARETLAGLDRDLAQWDHEAARIEVFARVAAAYVDVLAGQARVTVAEKTHSVVEQVHTTVSSRVDAGVASPIEQSRSAVALAASRISVQRARRMLEVDRIRLATSWGAESAVFDSVEGDLHATPPLPLFDALQQRLSDNPEIARWAAEIAQRDAVRAVEEARRVPDITLSAGYRRFTSPGGNAWVAGASVPLPIFDRNRAGVQAADDRVAKAHEEQQAARLRALAALAGAYGALASAHDEASALAADVLPAARSAFDAVEEGYRLGRFGFLDVLDAQRTLVAAEAQHVDALAAVHRGVANIERLTGMPLAVR